MVTSDATSGLTLATAACITGADRSKVHRLPDTAGIKNEVIIQKSHRYAYDHAVRNCGIRYIEIEPSDEFDLAVNAIGRGMKVNKEELLGMMVALGLLLQARPNGRLARVGESPRDYS